MGRVNNMTDHNTAIYSQGFNDHQDDDFIPWQTLTNNDHYLRFDQRQGKGLVRVDQRLAKHSASLQSFWMSRRFCDICFQYNFWSWSKLFVKLRARRTSTTKLSNGHLWVALCLWLWFWLNFDPKNVRWCWWLWGMLLHEHVMQAEN